MCDNNYKICKKNELTQEKVKRAIDDAVQGFAKKEDIPDNLQTILNATAENIKHLESLVAQTLSSNNVTVKNWMDKISNVTGESLSPTGKTLSVSLNDPIKDFSLACQQKCEFNNAVILFRNNKNKPLINTFSWGLFGKKVFYLLKMFSRFLFWIKMEPSGRLII